MLYKLRLFLAVLVLGTPLQLISQNQIWGTVVSAENGGPIPYVNLGVAEKNIGTVSDEKGEFSFDIGQIAPSDSVIFSIVGYKRKAVTLRELLANLSPQKIELREHVIKLAEVVIEVDPSNSKVLGVQRVSGKKFGFVGGIGAGAEISRKMRISQPSVLNTASIYVKNKKDQSFKLRLNVYTADPKEGSPGRSLLSQSIILESDLQEGWLSYDFKEPVVVNHAFYISYEWVESNLQNPMIALRGNNLDERVRVRPVSMGKWIMGGNYDFAIRCEVMND
ncbi:MULTISPECIES: carboxypeptidase-like regulatory domain-containing protein [unclassified Imperialibacter]|uniref:carboxypeptidase-like regulatory domain-containing protein n=1 Tax=unclassified Imperialibacter TaxID=2629706 RepID=UPI001259290C|nr:MULTISPECIES: carboxypeptidase-like regulatory domain-containing protein [unclassified Imperialibacter]CAD5255540.1 conserved hypothetical protein [Imperialibacter sp. 89]CAD5261619.1 conserved hypothetical protein [Imperialibacter sp. 75]VVT32780.1 conserved hypothetical protein [Imperialibacter sp. EC-SDR9]